MPYFGKTGRFRPKNPKKYQGNYRDIVYRSNQELKFMKWLDRSNRVINWSSEEVIVSYKSSVDGTKHRYFPDFYVEFTNNQKFLLEYKPLAKTKPPILNKKNKKQSIELLAEYQKNLDKWKYAKAYCKDKSWEFRVITEKTVDKLK